MRVGGSVRVAAGFILATSLVLCSGCENASATRINREAATASATREDPQWWVEPLLSTQRQYLHAILEMCRPMGLLEHDTCVRENMIASLGVGLAAAAHCEQEAGTVLFVACIDRGTSAERAYVALGRESEMDWGNPAASLVAAATFLSDHLTSQCRYSRQNDCLAREITYLFALDAREADRCVRIGDATLQVRCAIGLSMLEKYRSALLYVG